MKSGKIDIYPFNGRKLNIIPTGDCFKPTEKQARYIAEKWKSKNGWASSWIATARSISFSDTGVTINAGVTRFHETNGWLADIEQNGNLFPKYIPSISIGMFPVTLDDYLLVPRRNFTEVHAPGVWNVPGGYMNSMLVMGREGCDAEHFKKDPRVFDINFQRHARAHRQEFFGLTEDEIQFFPPHALVLGTYHSTEFEIGLIAKLKKTKEEMKEHIRKWEIAKGLPEHIHTEFVPLKDVPKLLENQPDTYKQNPLNHQPWDPTEIILLEDNVGELIGGGHKDMTGKNLPDGLLEKLRRGGLEINVLNTSPGKSYEFLPEIY